jgi:hypothetical protein
MLQTLQRWPRAIVIVASILIATLGVTIAFGTAAPPRPVQPRQLDLTDLPALSRYTARDGTQIAYRAYPGGGEQVAVLIHGTGTESSVMNALAKTLRAAGATVYAPDLRGHGSSGRRGDIDCIGQLDDDLADLVATIRPAHAHATLTYRLLRWRRLHHPHRGRILRQSFRSIHCDRPGHRLSVSACVAERRWLGDALSAPHRWADHPRQDRHSLV